MGCPVAGRNPSVSARGLWRGRAGRAYGFTGAVSTAVPSTGEAAGGVTEGGSVRAGWAGGGGGRVSGAFMPQADSGVGGAARPGRAGQRGSLGRAACGGGGRVSGPFMPQADSRIARAARPARAV